MSRPILKLSMPSKRLAKPHRRPTGVECLAQLAQHYPALFDPASPKPLALGVHKAMSADSGLSRTRIRRGLRVWTNTPEYLQALAKGGPRHGIDRQHSGDVTEWEQAQAVKRLKEMPE